MDEEIQYLKQQNAYLRLQTFWDLKDEIDEYMEYYNNYRYQWELKQMSPDEYYTYLLTGFMPY
ncbi:IS3 family transposase [Lacrimispora xylanisolvens]|uniref:IS3 family transposase n=1 Tax=Lacrimispora xylanisolvens TaxID=384636 RepID=UPI003D9CB909